MVQGIWGIYYLCRIPEKDTRHRGVLRGRKSGGNGLSVLGQRRDSISKIQNGTEEEEKAAWAQKTEFAKDILYGSGIPHSPYTVLCWLFIWSRKCLTIIWKRAYEPLSVQVEAAGSSACMACKLYRGICKRTDHGGTFWYADQLLCEKGEEFPVICAGESAYAGRLDSFLASLHGIRLSKYFLWCKVTQTAQTILLLILRGILHSPQSGLEIVGKRKMEIQLHKSGLPEVWNCAGGRWRRLLVGFFR